MSDNRYYVKCKNSRPCHAGITLGLLGSQA